MPNQNKHIPIFDLKRCIRCGACVTICPSNAITSHEGYPDISDGEKCTLCAECESVCPVEAISVPFRIEWAG